MKAISKSTIHATLLVAGLVAADGNALAQAPAGQAPATQPRSAPAPRPVPAPEPVRAAAQAPAPAPVPAPAVPAAPAVAPAPAPAPAAVLPRAAPAAAPPVNNTQVNALPAAPPFPTDASEAAAAVPMQPMPGNQLTAPRVIAVEPAVPPEPPSPPKTNYPIGLELSFMPVWQTSPSYDLFSTNDISTRVGLSLDLDLVDVAEKTPLSVEAGWSTESQSETALNGQLSTELSAHNLHGGLKLRHQLLSFLAPHVRLAGGATSLSADYRTTASSSREFGSHEWLAFGSVGAGVTATLPAPLVVRPGLTLEGGYLVSESMPLRLEPKSGAQSLATSGAALGTLERSGPYLRFGIFIRY